MLNIDEMLRGARRIGIAGHVNPDGDCIGSCTALMMYIRSQAPEAETDLYLELPEKSLRAIRGFEEARQTTPDGMPPYDLFITCDTSNAERIGVARDLFARAGRTLCIDHHVSNEGFADVNYIEPEASSCSEILARLIGPERTTPEMAESLYTGIIHDCGVFQYSNTTPDTLRTAASLLEKGVPFSRIIDETFNSRTFDQGRILGFALERAKTACGGLLVSSGVTLEDQERFHVTPHDLGLIVSQLRFTAGAEAAMFLYETEPGLHKVSLRSCSFLNVAEIASLFGGGGHVRAAGCSVRGNQDEIARRLTEEIGKRLEET